MLTGCEGPEGPAGKDGTNGTNGTPGAQGDPGAQGTPGTPGGNGADGSVITISPDGYWVIDGVKQATKAVGADGADGVSFSVNGSVADEGDLPTTLTNADIGKGWLVGSNLYIYVGANNGADGPNNAWNDVGQLQGPRGPAGPAGQDGATGQTGQTGPQGAPGKDGTSVNIKGSVAAVANLPATGNTLGDGYLIGVNLYVYVGSGGNAGPGNAWQDVGQIKGTDGITTHMVIFYPEGGKPEPKMRAVLSGNPVDEPQAPVQDRLEFAHWEAEGTTR